MENNKFENLKQYLNSLKEQGICLAFSGGVDSALLLWLCKDLNSLALTVSSLFQTDEEIEFTKNFCKQYGIKHKILTFNPLENERISTNPKDRCYWCKKSIFNLIKNETCKNENILDGTNADDLNVYRPGLKVLEELGVISPFVKFGIGKKEIRDYAKSLGLSFYNKPANPCAATRFPYDTPLTEENINKVKKAEKFLNSEGFNELRARVHGDILRLEVPESEFAHLLENKNKIITELKTLGYRYITLDIEGLRCGSMDN